ncbi:MAG: protein translocase subunit SecF [Polyangiales bacterium]
MELIKPGTRIDFMGMRKFWIWFSTIAATLSFLAIWIPPGPNYGTDFRGGTELEVHFKKPIDAAGVRKAVESIEGFSRPDVVNVGRGDENRFLIRVQEHSSILEPTKQKVRQALCAEGGWSDENGKFVADLALDAAKCPAGSPKPTEVKFSPGGDKMNVRYEVNPDDALLKRVSDAIAGAGVQLRGTVDAAGKNIDLAVKGHDLSQAKEYRVEVQLKSKGDLLLDELRSKLGADMVPAAADKVEWVGPRAGKQLRDAAVKSVMFAIVFIMAYVAFRFDLRFAPGGILALLHDALVVIGVFIVLRREITLSTIAAILTIVSYSMSDTVIVYDRLRENLNKHRGMTFHEIINLSVSEMLSRTILTSATVLFSVGTFFVYGTGVIKDFALALFVGVIAGTYSSIFVAAPFTEWVDRKFFGSSAVKQKRKIKRANLTGPGGAKAQAQHQL